MKKRVMKKVVLIVAVVILALGAIIGIVLKKTIFLSHPELEGIPETGKWYRITPDGAMDAVGSDWHGLLKMGTENKVAVYFFGGGVAVDEYTAQRPLSQGGFYSDSSETDFHSVLGIGSDSGDNPFKDWTLIVLPYSTGDFHSGMGEYAYTDLKGNDSVLHHSGYRNYRLLMDKIGEYVGKPDKLLIIGFSAGGFGTALLSNDVITNYYKDVEDVTVCVDSSLLLKEDWADISRNMWKSPQEITERLVTDNITLDSLTALYNDYPYVKILFDCSVRDEALSAYQSYFDHGVMSRTNEDGDVFQDNLRNMIKGLQENIPGVGIYIWDGIPADKETNLTLHTIISVNQFYSKKLDGHVSIADWIMDAVNGDVNSYGLGLLGKEH